MEERTLTVFAGSEAITTGSPETVTGTLRQLGSRGEQRVVLVFDDASGEQVDLDLRAGTDATPAVEPERRGPGRPKLGVVAREVTLLPRHWEWLNAQPGGASVALRKLVENARRESADSDRVRRSQEAAFRFMSATAGNESGFEEACRALFGGNRQAFEAQLATWPPDLAAYATRLAAGAFGTEA